MIYSFTFRHIGNEHVSKSSVKVKKKISIPFVSLKYKIIYTGPVMENHTMTFLYMCVKNTYVCIYFFGLLSKHQTSTMDPKMTALSLVPDN